MIQGVGKDEHGIAFNRCALEFCHHYKKKRLSDISQGKILKLSHKIKSIIKKVAPDKFRTIIFLILKNIKLIAKKIFERAPETPIWLGRDILESLQQKYHKNNYYDPQSRYYDPQSLEQRGKKRAREILSLVGKEKEKINTFLELGCADGMVSSVLQSTGKITTAIDNRYEGFDERAVREGVTLLKMDATNLYFKDESFDFVFSYDAFEHFAKPELMLQEAIRVVKTGGYIYLNFGPIYMSPWGLHAWESITVPYCQFLFPKEMLQDFANVRGLKKIDFAQLNMLSLEDYRKLWNRYSHRLKRIYYNEGHNLFHLDVIMKYPSCFKSKTKCFDNLTGSSINVLFKKII